MQKYSTCTLFLLSNLITYLFHSGINHNPHCFLEVNLCLEVRHPFTPCIILSYSDTHHICRYISTLTALLLEQAHLSSTTIKVCTQQQYMYTENVWCSVIIRWSKSGRAREHFSIEGNCMFISQFGEESQALKWLEFIMYIHRLVYLF